jgi:MoxR-like ATPase
MISEGDPTLRPEDSGNLSMPVVACMGTAACRRVCRFYNSNLEVSPNNDPGAFPGEQSCSVLGDVSDIQPDGLKELLDATALPSLPGMSSEQVVAEANEYLQFLTDGEKAHQTYLEGLLAGTSLPRFELARRQAAYEETTEPYESAQTPEQVTDEEKGAISVFHAQLRGFYDRSTLQSSGLLFDSSMRSVMETGAREIGIGHHIKLVGEPGIAKTTLAKHLALLNSRTHHPDVSDDLIQPVVVSFSSTSEAEAHVNEQTFEEGTLGSRLGDLADAMKRGVGVVLDEQNGMTADQQIFFNDLLLKKPGEQTSVASESFTIAEGFCVIATLNAMTDAQGNRRHGRQQQDSANAARFTRIDLKYPHQRGYTGNDGETVSRLFFIRYVDNFGWKTPDAEFMKLVSDSNELLKGLTKKATEPTEDATTTAASLARAQSRPDLAECISPRDLDRILASGLAYGDSAGAVVATRKAMYDKTQQILNSDNGHFVSPTAREAINTLLANGKFNA